MNRAFTLATLIIAAVLCRDAAARDAAGCAVRLDGKPFSYMELLVGSPDGKNGTIAQNGSVFDATGKHGRDLFPLADEVNVFLRCHYEGGRTVVAPVPPGTLRCEVDYTYINDYDTRADRIFCR